MLKLSKLLLILVTICSLLNIYKPGIAIAATDSEVTLPVNNCQGALKGKIVKATLSREPAIDWPMNLTVDILDSAPRKPTYYGYIDVKNAGFNPVLPGRSGGLSLDNLTIQTSSEGNFYHLVFPMPITRVESNRNIQLVYTEGNNTNQLGCDFGQFYFSKAGGNHLNDISCTIEVPDNIKYGTSDLVIKTTVTPVKEVFYKLYMLEGDSGRLTRSIFDFASVPPDKAIDRSPFTKATGFGAHQSTDITDATQEIRIPEVANLDMGEIMSFVIEAREPVSFRGGTEDFGKYCAVRRVSIWEKETSEPKTGSGADLAEAASWYYTKSCKDKSSDCSGGGGITNSSCVDGILTAIGCLHTKPQEFVKDFMKFAIGFSGGLAFLLMLSGAFQMITSNGNPETLKSGQDRLTSAVIGLMLIIFATLLLQIIGVNILGIFQP